MNRTLRVLMLEDNPTDAELTLATLAAEGIQCEAVRLETREAFTNALCSGERFDLILSDCALPAFDGLSALTLAKTVAPSIPFIFISGTIGEEVAIESLKNGATDYVLKQRLARLAPAVTRAVAEAEQHAAREAAEKGRSRAESLFQALFDQMTVGVAITDLQGCIERSNAALRSMCGHSESELEDTPLCQLGSSQDIAWRTIYDELIAGTRLSYEFEEQYLRRDGSTLWGRTVVSTIRGGESLSHLVHLIDDVTESKELARRFVETQKMEVAGRLAAGVAHDFNNLLTVINGYSSLLLSRLEKDQHLRRDLEEIRAAGERASRLTQRLLTFTSKRVEQNAVIDLNAVIRNLVPMLLRVCGEESRLTTDLDSGPVFVCIVQTEMEQVILNLVINARDAMSGGGEVKIQTEVLELDKALAGHLRVDAGTYAMLTVADTGHGMDAATRSRIFEPFFTTKEVGKGTGLGLWMVQQLVQQSGGAITVESAIRKGTTFRICLPCAAHPAEASGPAQIIAGGIGRGETILVVEDDDAVRGFLAETLRAAGYRPLTSPNAADALTFSLREPDEIHLLLADLSMPGMEGSELATRFLERRPNTKVLLMSGHSDRLERALASPDWRSLAKPFSSEALLQSIATCLNHGDETRILVVDDDPAIRTFVALLLRQAGYTVLEAANGAQADDYLHESHIDILLTDLIMPDREGLETIRAVKKDFPGIRVIAMSGGFGAQFLEIAGRMGADASIPKPFEAGTLLTAVRRLLPERPATRVQRAGRLKPQPG